MKTSRHHRPSADEAIEATAAAWLAQRDDGLTPAESAAFARWRQADPRHEAAVVRLEAAWGALQQLRDFRPEARMHPDRDLLRGARPARRVVPFAVVVPAALAACLALAAVWWWAAGGTSHGQRYATTVDGYQRVALEDGSVLELNANTEVQVQFSPSERRVSLERGEAHFTVAKDKARPFRVGAGSVAVYAVGTAFNVRRRAADVEVLVTEGKVEVDQSDPAPDADSSRKKLGRSPSRSGGSGEVHALSQAFPVLVAGQRVVIPTVPTAAAVTPVVDVVAPEVIREELAWQGPRLVFVDTPLREVIEQFNRRNQVQLILGDAELGGLPVGGSFRAENVDAFVRLLVTGNDIVAERPDAGRVVLRREK